MTGAWKRGVSLQRKFGFLVGLPVSVSVSSNVFKFVCLLIVVYRACGEGRRRWTNWWSCTRAQRQVISFLFETLTEWGRMKLTVAHLVRRSVQPWGLPLRLRRPLLSAVMCHLNPINSLIKSVTCFLILYFLILGFQRSFSFASSAGRVLCEFFFCPIRLMSHRLTFHD